ncbi:MAG: sulfite exporter TauE/SafE family protein [Brachymonas denitrificans]|jgi:sulfite exporter TauE/SafE|uniref:sulfite exporter TauE/SafE family protein n=1 Tax=Brachymonas denitrificans TaxID=28220 RepID=UPI001BCD4F34|nr:sulfite exporter TauE/SafE family protein [Brachymonas denitrificans]
MEASLIVTALLMGLAGGPHCIAMCGAACAGIGVTAGERPAQQNTAMGLFQVGRVLGYAGLGALAAATMQGLGWLTVQSAALRPVWSTIHVAALVLGVLLMFQGRQPAWLDRSARKVWERIKRLQQRGGSFGPVLVGMLWAFLPCGLLYSALMVAALTGVVWQGAAVMALFVLGTSVSLMAGPWLLLRMRKLGDGEWGIRLAGLALAISAGVALWMGLMHDQAPWCTTP